MKWLEYTHHVHAHLANLPGSFLMQYNTSVCNIRYAEWRILCTTLHLLYKSFMAKYAAVRDHPSWSHLVGLITGWRWSRISGFYKHGALESLDILKWGTSGLGSDFSTTRCLPTLAQQERFSVYWIGTKPSNQMTSENICSFENTDLA